MFVYAPCGDGKLYQEGCYTRTQVSADHVVISDGACPREKNKFFFNLLLFGENEQNIGWYLSYWFSARMGEPVSTSRNNRKRLS